MLTFDRRNQEIAVSFGRAAKTYNDHALLQQVGAQALVQLVVNHQETLPTGTILEIGCGTGLVSQGLIDNLPHRSLKITDLSPEMLAYCQSHLTISNQLCFPDFQVLDAEAIAATEQYAAIVGGFVLQWFRNPAQTLADLIDRLIPGGSLFLSFPTCHSFSEWQHLCQQLNLPYTANPMPDPEQLRQTLPPQAQLHQAQLLELTTSHNTAADFFRSLKAIGAGINQTQQRLSSAQMKALLQAWNQQAPGHIQVHYQVACWTIHRLF